MRENPPLDSDTDLPRGERDVNPWDLGESSPVWDGEGHEGLEPRKVRSPTEVIESPLGQEVVETGVDALAWYIPFHVSPSRWGIYYRETGIELIAEFLEAHGLPRGLALPGSFRFLESHEEFHGIVEAVLTTYELLTRRRVYLEADRDPWVTPNPAFVGLVEEALGNSDSIRASSTRARPLLAMFASLQPSGYSDWEDFRWRDPFVEGVDRYVNSAQDHVGIGHLAAGPTLVWARGVRWEIPRFVVRDAKSGPDLVFPLRYRGIELQVHFSHEHPPTHVHARFLTGGGEDRAYAYPSLAPARRKDPPLNSRQEFELRRAIEAYPRSKLEAELRRQEALVALRK